MLTQLYRRSGRFTGLLFIVALAIVLALLYYTRWLVEQLRGESRRVLEFYAQLYAHVASEESGELDLNFIFDEIIQRTNFPIINTDNNRNPVWWKGIPVSPDDRSPQAYERVKRMVRRMEREIDPIPLKYQDYLLGYLYYGDSKLITHLQYLPYIEIGVIGLFISVSFLAFRSIKRSEQRYIWVGMAKETAHQLGTPLSSLMGWLEVLKSDEQAKPVAHTLSEMENDVKRLYKVAARFSQIGSRADLKEQDVVPVLQDVVNYIRRRLPHMGKEIKIVERYQPVPLVPLNRDLFEWVVENLLKNALDAIEKERGLIEINLGELKNRTGKLYIDIKDNGRGIESKNKRAIFKPGYSTKKRGWGLGLNLARRIVEEYHGGKLFLKETRVGEGTTMRIVL